MVEIGYGSKALWYGQCFNRKEVTDDTKGIIVENVKNRFIAEGYKVIDVDGARVIVGHGWGLVRYSNTGPNLTIKAESTTEEEANKIIEQIKEYINDEREKLNV